MKWIKTESGGWINLDKAFHVHIFSCDGLWDVRAYFPFCSSDSNIEGKIDGFTSEWVAIASFEKKEEAKIYLDELFAEE